MAGLNGGMRPCGNGRNGGGAGGSEDRYHFPAVDEARWNEAKTGKVDRDERWGGEAGTVLGSYANTMAAPRGKIMGAQGPGCDAPNGFMK